MATRFGVLAFGAVLSGALLGCSGKPDKAPTPPHVSDPRNIVIDGVRVSGRDYLARFCSDRSATPGCELVHRTVSADSASSASGPVRF